MGEIVYLLLRRYAPFDEEQGEALLDVVAWVVLDAGEEKIAVTSFSWVYISGDRYANNAHLAFLVAWGLDAGAPLLKALASVLRRLPPARALAVLTDPSLPGEAFRGKLSFSSIPELVEWAASRVKPWRACECGDITAFPRLEEEIITAAEVLDEEAVFVVCEDGIGVRVRGVCYIDER